MSDDLTRARAKRIARARTTSQIREAIRNAAQFCPACGELLRTHDDAALDRCAMKMGDAS